MGRKTSAGWYDHAAEGPIPSEHVTARVRAAAAEAGVTRRVFSAEQIVDRLVTAIVAEGHAILQDGIAATASDIDLVEIHGYGFPRWRGGPMFYGRTIGGDALRARIAEFAAADPVTWAGVTVLAD